MTQTHNLTRGPIAGTLARFAIPVLITLFLQALYGAVDLLIVGQFAHTAHISGVATGSILLQTVTLVVTELGIGVTILAGEKIGQKDPRQAGQVIGNGILLFGVIALLMTAFLVVGAPRLATLLHAPEGAFEETVSYIRICGAGSIFIVAYNLLGSIFRGVGDSRTPLLTVAIASCINIAGDLLLVAGFHMGASGAAIATVFAQGASVGISFILMRKKELPFQFSKEFLHVQWKMIFSLLRIGLPVALQELLVGLSFLVIQTVVNTFGVVVSAGVGVAEKVCGFIMLVPSAYMQSMSAFVAQNMGAQNPFRAKKALGYGIATSLVAGVFMFYLSFFHGDLLSGIFSKDVQVIAASQDYLRAYAIDCLLTPFLFCFMGFFNGMEKTVFVMLQGIFGAFCVRIPIVYWVSRLSNVTLFEIALATPASTVVQILLCLGMFLFWNRSFKNCDPPNEQKI